LILAGANLNTRNKYGETPLYLAVYYSNFEVAEVLLTYSADVNAKTKSGRSLLDIACHDIRKLMEQRLIEQILKHC